MVKILGKIIFVSGGTRSGKTSFAQKMAEDLSDKLLYLATAQVFDNEMQDRVDKHKKERGETWDCLEAYKNLPKLLKEASKNRDVILLDCLTLLITSLLFEEETDWDNIKKERAKEIEGIILKKIKEILNYFKNYKGTVIIVTNELGMGIVPETYLGRYFRDVAGLSNQLFAKESNEAYLIVSGLPIKLK